MRTPASQIEDFLKQDKENLERCNKKIKRLFYLRLIRFLGIFLCVIVLPYPFLVISASAFTALFLYFVRKNISTEKQRDFLKRLTTISENELLALQEEFQHFSPGNEFINPGHLFSFDLDLFGEGSLFQFLNRTTTPLEKNG